MFTCGCAGVTTAGVNSTGLKPLNMTIHPSNTGRGSERTGRWIREGMLPRSTFNPIRQDGERIRGADHRQQIGRSGLPVFPHFANAHDQARFKNYRFQIEEIHPYRTEREKVKKYGDVPSIVVQASRLQPYWEQTRRLHHHPVTLCRSVFYGLIRPMRTHGLKSPINFISPHRRNTNSFPCNLWEPMEETDAVAWGPLTRALGWWEGGLD